MTFEEVPLSQCFRSGVGGVLTVLLAGCGQPELPCPDSGDRWTDDFNALVTTLADEHEDAFSVTSKDAFFAEARARCDQVSAADPVAARMGMLAQAALVGDAHTGVNLYDGAQGFARYPIWPYWFAGELRVLAASQSNANLVGTRILRIGGLTPEEVEQRVAPYIAHRNAAQLRRTGYIFFTTVEVMEFLGIADHDGALSLEVTDGVNIWPVRLRRDSPRIRSHQPVPELAPERFSAGDGWVTVHPPTYARPLSLREPDAFYSAHRWSDVIYVKINVVRDAPSGASFREFWSREVQPQLGAARALIIDLRYNSGGDFNVTLNVLRDLRGGRLSREGRVFALIDRETFSAAQMTAYMMRREGGAKLVGEEPGDTLSSWNCTESEALPQTRISFSYSTGEPLYGEDRHRSLLPDMVAPLTWQAYLQGHDPALEAALELIPD